MTPPEPHAADTRRPAVEVPGQPGEAVVEEVCLTMASLRERGWTVAMIRDYLGEPDTTRPNPRYASAAPMKLYLARRAEAAEASPGWADRRGRAAQRRVAGAAAASRRRAETEELTRQVAADLVARLVLPADPRQAAVDAYNKWHSASCTCPGWRGLGFCDKRADAGDSPELLHRITVDYLRRGLTGYNRVYNRLTGRVGEHDAREILRAAVNTALKARLGERQLPGHGPDARGAAGAADVVVAAEPGRM